MSAPSRRGRVVVAVLLALAWIQVSYASHQFEHDAADRTDVCSVCSHFQRLDHAVPVQLTAPDLAVVHVFFEAPISFPTFAPFRRHYHSRAPPVVS